MNTCRQIDKVEETAGGDLCTACGLCCDGTLFDRLPVAPEEMPLAARSGARVERREGKSYAALPCPFLENSRCGVYAERYAVCRRYRCRLLRRVEENRLDVREAAHQVAEARRLRDAARGAAAAAGSPDMALAFRRRAAEWRDLPDPADRRTMAAAHLALVALDLFLSRHFRKSAPADT